MLYSMSSILVWEIVIVPNFMELMIRKTFMIGLLKNKLNTKFMLSGV
jgi:hypothetical protein